MASAISRPTIARPRGPTDQAEEDISADDTCEVDDVVGRDVCFKDFISILSPSGR